MLMRCLLHFDVDYMSAFVFYSTHFDTAPEGIHAHCSKVRLQPACGSRCGRGDGRVGRAAEKLFNKAAEDETARRKAAAVGVIQPLVSSSAPAQMTA